MCPSGLRSPDLMMQNSAPTAPINPPRSSVQGVSSPPARLDSSHTARLSFKALQCALKSNLCRCMFRVRTSPLVKLASCNSDEQHVRCIHVLVTHSYFSASTAWPQSTPVPVLTRGSGIAAVENTRCCIAVSYTHLTLPTKRIV